MAILIKGMAMPKSCAECFGNETVCAELYSWCGIAQKPISDITLRPQDCPLVELPPHGRLIDADAVMEDVCFDADVIWVWRVTDAPTIIEADSTQFNNFNALDVLESEGEE